MNKIFKKLIPGIMLLALPGFALAQTASETELDVLKDIRDYVDSEGNKDINRTNQIQALINFQAEELLKSYRIDEQKYFMMAPGSNEAIEAATELGKESSRTLQDSTKTIVGSMLSEQLGGGGLENLPGIGENPAQQIANGVNISLLLQQDRISSEEANKIITMLTNPPEKASSNLVKQAQMSASLNALGEMAAKRLEGGSNKSFAQILREESERRFEDTDWYAKVGVASQEALIRELVEMEAFRTKMQYEQYKLQEQTVSLLSILTAQQARMSEVFSELTTAMRQASRSADAAKAEAQAQAEEQRQKAEEAEESGDTSSSDEDDAEAAADDMLNQLQ